MVDRYSQRILDHIADPRYEPATVRQLARDLSVPGDQIEDFRRVIEQLLDDGQTVLGSADTVDLPPPSRHVVGTFRRHERGFGFIVPDKLTKHGDLFVSPGSGLDAMTGDRVRAVVTYRKRRASPSGGGRSPYTARVVEVLQRADRQYVGVLVKRDGRILVEVDGRVMHDPVVVRDPHARNARPGDKVAVELIDYPDPSRGELPEGVITEVLGDAGEPKVETLAVMRAFGLPVQFGPEVIEQARAIGPGHHSGDVPADREDLTTPGSPRSPDHRFIVTIDPPDARDFDDAISVRRLDGGAGYELAVHIADVSHFVPPGSALDREARARGNSTYLPRRVIPMLPELLSNGVCSLQEGVNRLCKSCFLRYDTAGNVREQRFARTVIRSNKRLTYREAQALIDGDLPAARQHTMTEPKYPAALRQTLALMDELARIIQQRRLKDGMIVLALPEVELTFDEAGRVIDAVPEDNAFTHAMIEMFMVEANEAAARLFDRIGVEMIRRVHPDPGAHEITELRAFAGVAGYNIPARPSRKELQTLLDAVRGKPAQRAVHLAVLKTLSKAEYSPALIGHFALATDHYTHFTSPIRRYPDLIVHRGLDAYLDHAAAITGKNAEDLKRLARAIRDGPRVPDEKQLAEIGRHCSNTEKNSEAAEKELRNYLVLEFLSGHLGEDFDGTVTGMTSAGVFVQLGKYLVDGFIRSADFAGSARGDRWKLNRVTGAMVAQHSGETITIGDRFTVRIARVDPAARQLDLVIIDGRAGKPDHAKRAQPQGARRAHQQTQKLKAVKRREARSRRGLRPPRRQR